MNNEDFKIDLKNDPRIMANTFSSNKEISSFTKVYLHYVFLEKVRMMVSCAHLGVAKQLKCFMIIRRRQFIMTMR